MIKTYKKFESVDNMITTYIFGIPSGEVIDVTEDEIVMLKKQRILKYDNKYRAFIFLDLNYNTIMKILNRSTKSAEKADFIYLFLEKLGVSRNNIKIYDDLSVDVFEDVDMSQRGLTKIPFKFNIVDGNFDCGMNKLETLINSPDIVVGMFDCSLNKIYTLIGGPTSVSTGYYCSDNKLENLEGYPSKCGVIFDCSKNNIKTLKGLPKKIYTSQFDISHNELTNLMNGPTEVMNFDCSHNKIVTLSNGIIKAKGKFYCTYNRLLSLLGAPTCDKIIYKEGNEINDTEYD